MATIMPSPDDPPTGARKRTGFVGNPRRASRGDALSVVQHTKLFELGRGSLIQTCFDEFGCVPSVLSNAAATALLAWYEKENSNANRT